ncbi:hypothetical protein DL771_011833 [Monosporascus sp. 5C6A]|nr:hypothetical protein DL771_011833 [Monosporascus sp. 5C6A]
MSFSNPRRTPAPRQDSDAPNGLRLKTNLTLRKGATFHSPTTPPSSPPAPTFRVPSLPRRSQTNLDDVLDAHRRRAAIVIGRIEDTLADTKVDSAPSRRSFRDNSLPIPRGVLDHTVLDGTMASNASNTAETDRRVLRPRHRRSSRHHESDSGLGSSIASVSEKKETASSGVSAINRSAVTIKAEFIPRLSDRAINRIHEHTLGPLLAKRSLKEFRSIVLDCPRRIQEKQIVCLRDLEKTLIFMAPVSQLINDPGVWGVAYRTLCLKERAKTAELYLDFCITSIRCIQATVEYLTDREQTRPHDRPYNHGYFIDLVEQVRQHARQMKEARDRQASGETLDEMDVDPCANQSSFPWSTATNSNPRSDEVKLMGGLTENGRPAELVRVKKNGKAISIATGQPVEYVDEETKGPIRFKRSMSQQLEDEEEIMRSMARRKKNASPEELAPKKCKEPGCNKEFKRPCDLTKHEKTHSRPWKCPIPTCKYHEFGWPTEKEMDRHVNDKHSASPPMYECKFKPCPYKSKRESNCKQHMEKAHGWTYVRTKSNGSSKKGEAKSDNSAKHTPLINNLPTPSSEHSNPVMTPPEETVFPFHQLDPLSHINFPAYPTSEEFNANLEPSLYDREIQLDFSEDFSPIDNPTPSTDAGQFNTYQDLSPEFTGQFEDIYGAHVQLPTPPNQIYNKAGMEVFSNFASEPALHPPTAHISPVGQGNAMLYTPTSMAEVDEGFEEYQCTGQLGEDFLLFPPNSMSKQEEFDNLFAPSLAGGFTQPSSQDFNIDYNQHMDWTASDFQAFPNHH